MTRTHKTFFFPLSSTKSKLKLFVEARHHGADLYEKILKWPELKIYTDQDK